MDRLIQDLGQEITHNLDKGQEYQANKVTWGLYLPLRGIIEPKALEIIKRSEVYYQLTPPNFIRFISTKEMEL